VGREYRTFISWAKDTKPFADAFRQWLGDLLQASKPFVSSRDLKSGLWGPQLTDRLVSVRAGVVLVTPGTQHEPWLLFETGGLVRSTGYNEQVCVLLVDGNPADIDGPLTDLQVLTFGAGGVRTIVQQINRGLDEGDQDDASELDRRFLDMWTTLEAAHRKWLQARGAKPAATPRDEREMLEEILTRVRRLEEPSRTVKPPLRFGSLRDAAMLLERGSSAEAPPPAEPPTPAVKRAAQKVTPDDVKRLMGSGKAAAPPGAGGGGTATLLPSVPARPQASARKGARPQSSGKAGAAGTRPASKPDAPKDTRASRKKPTPPRPKS